MSGTFAVLMLYIYAKLYYTIIYKLRNANHPHDISIASTYLLKVSEREHSLVAQMEKGRRVCDAARRLFCECADRSQIV
jgi:phage-related tail fiber protein